MKMTLGLVKVHEVQHESPLENIRTISLGDTG